jgi:Protein of unknown function (DUF5672)
MYIYSVLRKTSIPNTDDRLIFLPFLLYRVGFVDSRDSRTTFERHYDVFYAFGHEVFPTVTAIGHSMNVYEYVPAPTRSNETSFRAVDSASRVMSGYDVMIVRDDQDLYESFVAAVQPIIVDMLTSKETFPSIAHVQTHGNLAVLSDFVMHGAFAEPYRRFARVALPILRTKDTLIAEDQKDKSANMAVIVEPQITAGFELAVRSVMYHLRAGGGGGGGGEWSLVVIHSRRNEVFVTAALADLEANTHNIKFVLSTEPLDSVGDYNAMLKKASFWRSLGSSVVKALIFQSDSLMMGSDIERFMKYDYIGAPWDVDHNVEVKRLFDTGELTRGVGNGGFSLRSVKAMIDILDAEVATGSLPHTSAEPEDIFFARHLDKDPRYVMPSRSIAYSFCREEMVMSLELSQIKLPTRPLALHGAWKYSSSNPIYAILNDYTEVLGGAGKGLMTIPNMNPLPGIIWMLH